MIVVYILIGIVVLVGVLALIAPKEGHYQRSIVVSVPAQKAFSHLRSLKTFDIWSPWAERDPKQERGYKGTDGEIGSLAWWKGNKDVGEGEQEITILKPDTYVEMALRFLKPFKADNRAYFKIEAQGSSTKVTWGMHATYSVPMNIMMMMMNMDKRLGADFEKGLSTYKEWAEKQG